MCCRGERTFNGADLSGRRPAIYPKRLAGDDIDIRDDSVYLNDTLLVEAYAQGKTRRYAFTVVGKVPEDCVYVLGDNREFSSDSREFGFVSVDNIFGVWSGVRISLGSLIRKLS